MPITSGIDPKSGDTVVLVGTVKGAFALHAGAGRGEWRLGGPWFAGQAVYAMCYDGRAGRRRLWAASSSPHWGTVLRTSDDFGRTFTEPEAAPVRFPDDTGAALKQVWQLRTGGEAEPDVLYCGVEPAALFVSRDAGTSWSLMRGLWDHPHRPQWQPGGGGLCLHTIVPDALNPARLFVAISTGGVYRSDDTGASWRACNRGIRAPFLPDPDAEFGQCVHKMVQHPTAPERLYLQHHWGVYRSDDAGERWRPIGAPLPSDFGFAIAVHPHEPDTVYVLPLESDEFRCTPEGRLRVYRSRDGGETWHALTSGLPQEHAYETVLRDGLAIDQARPAGIYFGTRSGKVFGSVDDGESWRLLADGLPPVTCVKVAAP